MGNTIHNIMVIRLQLEAFMPNKWNVEAIRNFACIILYYHISVGELNVIITILFLSRLI